MRKRLRGCGQLAVLAISGACVALACGGSTSAPVPETSAGPVTPMPTPGEPTDPSAPGDPVEPAEPGGSDSALTQPAEPRGPVPKAPLAPAEPPEPATGPPSEAQAILDAHNRHRAKHCAPPVAWSDEVAAVALAWATKLRDAGCAFEHSRGRKYGENLFFMGPAGSARGAVAVDDWYSEVSAYDHANPGFGMSTGHFTQVVWRGTSHVGCGTARCPGGDIWVCNYYPPGNVLGQFPQNVLPTSCK